MPSKVVAHIVIVNLVLWTTFLITACSTSSQHESDRYIEKAQRAHEADRVAEARTFARLALEDGRRASEAREILAALSRARADKLTSEGEYLSAHDAYLEAADYESTPSRRGQDRVNALQAGDRAGLADDTLMELALVALQDLPRDIELRSDIARRAEDRGAHELAIDQYLWLFSAQPENTGVGLRLGILYLNQDRPNDAVSVLQRVYELEPNNVQAALNLAAGYTELLLYREAAEIFQQLQQRFPEHPAVLRRHADFEEARGRHHRARELRQKAGDASPGIEQREMRPLR